MSVYTIIATVLAIIGVISAIIGTGFFAIGSNYKESITVLQSALQIHKDAGEAKDEKIVELGLKITNMGQELEAFKKQYRQLKKINLRLQRENLHWREELSKMHKTDGLAPVPPYVDDTIDDDDSDITVPTPPRKGTIKRP